MTVTMRIESIVTIKATEKVTESVRVYVQITRNYSNVRTAAVPGVAPRKSTAGVKEATSAAYL